MKYLYSLIFFALIGCTPAQQSHDAPATANVHFADATTSSDEFGDYWYQGEAEITSYDLKQARYGEIHDGHAVLIFVTEDFSKKKHVKLDNPQTAGNDKVSVLKLNASKKFNTGIYPYSMMSSVFTPIPGDAFPRTLKVTTTSQEWCGHTFTQFNLERNKYNIEFRSYFESEGDQDLKLDNAMLEDEVWTAIRLSPDRLPTGKVDMIPGTMYQRLAHVPFKVHQVDASMVEQEDNLMTYTISYTDLDRSLSITFNKNFPHEIDSWEEANGELTTRATRKKQMMLDYWSRHDVADLPLRQELGLE